MQTVVYIRLFVEESGKRTERVSLLPWNILQSTDEVIVSLNTRGGPTAAGGAVERVKMADLDPFGGDRSIGLPVSEVNGARCRSLRCGPKFMDLLSLRFDASRPGLEGCEWALINGKDQADQLD